MTSHPPHLVVLAAVDRHTPPVLHLGPDVEAVHAAVDDLGDDAGGEAGGQGLTPLAVRSACRPGVRISSDYQVRGE